MCKEQKGVHHEENEATNNKPNFAMCRGLVLVVVINYRSVIFNLYKSMTGGRFPRLISIMEETTFLSLLELYNGK